MSDDVIPPLTRQDVIEIAKIAAAILDNPGRSESARLGAAKVFAECSYDLAFLNDVTQRIRLVPLAFRVRNFYTDVLSALVAQMSPKAKDKHHLSLLMAEKAVKIIDTQNFSADMRLDARDALMVVLDGVPDAHKVVD